MAVGIGDVMRRCRNYFETGYMDGEFVISGGKLLGASFADRYIAIQGSGLNDGVHKAGKTALQDETFTGRVWLLSPPAAFVVLCDEISAYDAKHPSGAYVSEAFGGYSYTRGTNQGKAQDWHGAYSDRLSSFQRLSSEVMV